jgi:hypothetical protein
MQVLLPIIFIACKPPSLRTEDKINNTLKKIVTGIPTPRNNQPGTNIKKKCCRGYADTEKSSVVAAKELKMAKEVGRSEKK